MSTTDPQPALTFRSLYSSPLISIDDYICRTTEGAPSREEESYTNTIVLMRHGAFCKHFGRRKITADVNQAVFFGKGSTYRVSHPSDCGDRGTVFTPSPRVLNDIVRELDPSVDDHADQPFKFVTGLCSSDIFKRHRELVMRLETANAGQLEPLWADVTSLQLIADVLETAFASTRKTRTRRREGTDLDHADRVEAAKAYLASHVSDRVTLNEIARAANTSPFHLARIFHSQAGVSLHRYLTVLRLRLARERLEEGADDLTIVALDHGFSSHSHFTDAFRKEFGCAPSEIRRRSR